MDSESDSERRRHPTPGSPDDPAESPPPVRVPDHEVGKRIGRGSYGGVYLARSVAGPFRAVKVVWRRSFSSERPYEREFSGIKQFEPISRSHPGVVEILHIGRDTEAGCFYYVMELADPVPEADGSTPAAFSPASYEPRTLAAELKRRGRLPVNEVLTLGVQLAEALDHIHRHRLIHRDVKPSNVIFVGGRAKLADIGLLTATDQARSFVGTEGFIPPEGPGTPRADIFALGRLLYEAATGKDRSEFPELPTDLDGWNPSERSGLLELNEVLARACAPRASQRHDSAREVAADLALLLAGRSVRRAYGLRRLWKIAAMTIVVAAAGALLYRWRVSDRGALESQASAHVASIAVLPFVNRSGSADDEYFSDGLGDELLNLLGKIDGLRVAGKTSATQFKGKDTPIPEIGRQLHVGAVLEGSVRKSGQRVRIAVRLVNVADGYQLWSESYDRSLQDLFALQDDIARSVVDELRSKFLGGRSGPDARSRTEAEVAKAAKGRGTDPEAHRMYLLARFMNDWFTETTTARAIQYLEEALKRDPQLALGWAELSRAYSNQAANGWTPAAAGYERSRAAAAKALALEPDLAEGHSAIGWIQMNYDWDWHGADASFGRALQLAPGNALVLRRAGALAEILGRLDEAIALCRQAVEQDPLNSGSYTNLGHAFMAADRAAEAEQAFRRARDLAPERGNTSSAIALSLLRQGRVAEALEEANREQDRPWRAWAMALVHHTAGHPAQSDEALQEMHAKYEEDFAYQLAEVHATRGEADAAFRCLDRALSARDTGLAEAKVDPWLRSLHRDPRWTTLMKALRLEG
jgi:TolB-like protein/Tfp pilus assembly protein PilF